MIPLAIPNTGPLEAEYLAQCIRENFVSSVGPFVTRLESEIGQMHGVGPGVAVAAGTMGLHVSLVVLGVKPGDLVISPSFTFIASANAISHAGATPWLLDIDRDSWTLSPAAVEKALRDETEQRADGVYHRASGRRVAGIMPVYTLGTVADMDAIGALAREYQLPVLADAAAAIGVDYRGRPIGDLADLTVFSFNGNKTITTGGGGMVIGADQEVLRRVRHLTTTARATADYEHDAIGWNYRLTNIEAAVGCAQLERLDEFLIAKRRIRRVYDEAFASVDGFAPFPQPEGSGTTCWFSGAVLAPGRTPRVPEICAALRERGIEARPFWKPVHLQPPYRDAPTGDLTVSDDVWANVLTLPCSTSLTEAEQTQVIDAVLQIVKR